MDEILEETRSRIDEIIQDYETYLAGKFESLVYKDSSLFYNYLNRKTDEARRSCLDEALKAFKAACAAASIYLFKESLSLFAKAVKTYIYSAFSQYKSLVVSLFSKSKERLSEAAIRDSLLKEVLSTKKKAANIFRGRENLVISVGKRSFKLSNYIKLVLEQEVREKFNINMLKAVKKNGAIGIKISNHGTLTPICKPYEGKTFYFKNGGLSKLKIGLPPFHVNCKHFVIPVYADK